MFGEVTNKDIAKFSDLGAREILMFAPIAVLVIILGIYPSVVTDITGPSVQYLVVQINSALGAVK
jgi:NADH-quinone oxidoreductase subunit M